MRIDILPDDISFIAAQGVDIHRFIHYLAPVESLMFPQVDVRTAWGLVIFHFKGPLGHCTCALGIDVLLITKEEVVSDKGEWVDRYEKVAEELLKRANDKMKLPVELRELRRSSILAAIH